MTQNEFRKIPANYVFAVSRGNEYDMFHTVNLGFGAYGLQRALCLSEIDHKIASGIASESEIATYNRLVSEGKKEGVGAYTGIPGRYFKGMIADLEDELRISFPMISPSKDVPSVLGFLARNKPVEDQELTMLLGSYLTRYGHC